MDKRLGETTLRIYFTFLLKGSAPEGKNLLPRVGGKLFPFRADSFRNAEKQKESPKSEM